jgi:ABC-type transport system involved in multi-copper enzyme maturation permease subunit
MGTIFTLAQGTFGEAIRRKILNIFLIVALAMIGLYFAFQSFSPREDLTITLSTGLGVISLAGVFISVILGINLVPAEIEKRTIYTILSKPVRRHEFLLGKYFGGLATVFVNVALMGIFFIASIWIKIRHPEAAVWEGVLMIFFEMMLLSSVALLFSVFVSPFVNFFLTFSVFLLGSMSSITESLATPAKNKNPITTWFFEVVHFLIPNFGNFNIQNPIIHPDITIKNPEIYMLQVILYGIIYSAIMLLVAILIFDRREV